MQRSKRNRAVLPPFRWNACGARAPEAASHGEIGNAQRSLAQQAPESGLDAFFEGGTHAHVGEGRA